MYEFLNYHIIDTSDDSLAAFKQPYIVFNTLEALVWFGCSVWVLVRYRKNAGSGLEVLYFLAFLAFGLTDVIETFGTTVLLLLTKGCCLLALIPLRQFSLVRYPGSRF